jgi:hypothetical protein
MLKYNLYCIVFGYWDAVRIVNSFYYNLIVRNYKYILHCYTFTQLTILTRQYSILSVRSVWHSLAKCRPLTANSSQSQSYIATDGQSVSKAWCRAPSGAHDQIFITVWQLRPCLCGAPSLTRGRVCLLCMLLALASRVFLRSESLGISDHILLSQIWDFHFRRLLRLAGSRWRYSTPPPDGCNC